MQQDPLIVVGSVCVGEDNTGSGLVSLTSGVTFAQEHSVSKHLWQRLDPDFLILLECSYETIRRRKRVSWGVKRYRKQLALLSNARAHADLIVRTDGFSAEQLVEYVHRHLVELGMGRLSNGG